MIQNQLAASENYQQYIMRIADFKTVKKHTIFVSLIEENPVNSSLKAYIIKPIQQVIK